MSELDKRIAASVARGEAAIARQEAAQAQQEELKVRFDAAVVRQQEATARLETASAGLADQARREDQLLAEVVTDLREARDERRAMIEALLTIIDRLPPAQG